MSAPWIIFGGSLWLFVNGLLHDIFVLINHKGGYNRDLLRLLLDGHVLMLGGGVLFISFLMVKQNVPYGSALAVVVGASTLVYCGMIFPFLKSFGTMAVSLAVIAAAVYAWKSSTN